jgi:hypothetical protein
MVLLSKQEASSKEKGNEALQIFVSIYSTTKLSFSFSFSSRDSPVEVMLVPPVPLSMDSSSNSKPLVIRSKEVPAQFYSNSFESEPEMISGRLGRFAEPWKLRMYSRPRCPPYPVSLIVLIL